MFLKRFPGLPLLQLRIFYWSEARYPCVRTTAKLVASGNFSNFPAAGRGGNGIIRTSTSFAGRLLRPRCVVSDP